MAIIWKERQAPYHEGGEGGGADKRGGQTKGGDIREKRGTYEEMFPRWGQELKGIYLPNALDSPPTPPQTSN